MYVTRPGQIRTWHGNMHRGDKELPAHSMMQGEDNALVKTATACREGMWLRSTHHALLEK